MYLAKLVTCVVTTVTKVKLIHIFFYLNILYFSCYLGLNQFGFNDTYDVSYFRKVRENLRKSRECSKCHKLFEVLSQKDISLKMFHCTEN